MTRPNALSDLSGKTVVVLSPTYNDWRLVRTLLPMIDENLQSLGVKCRVVVVDDGSTDTEGRDQIADQSFDAIEAIDELALTRNQGNQRALAIGIGYVADNLSADYLIVMDSDHQDDPGYFRLLLEAALDGGDKKIVFAERSKRSEGLGFRLMYRFYQRLYRAFTGMSIAVGNFSVIPWPIVPKLANISELWSHYPAAIMRSRIPYAALPTVRGKRLGGSGWMNTVPLIAHAFGGFAVHAEFFAARMLIGAFALSCFVVLVTVGLIGQKIFTDIPLVGWTSTIIVLLVIVLGQIISTAVITLFLVLNMRTQMQAIPLQEYSRFILSFERLYGASVDQPS